MEVSDTGPGSSVADSSAAGQRATVDEPGMSPDKDLIIYMDLPLSGQINAFKSKSGLSQHERHMHPALRNVKRAEGAKPKRLGNRSTIWTDEELELLIQLNERFKNERFPNVKIREFIPNNILKQISDKRRILPTMGKADDTEEDDSNTASSVDKSVSGISSIEAPPEPPGDDDWKGELRQDILTGRLDESNKFFHLEKLIMESAAKDDAGSEEIDRILELAIRKVTEGTVEAGGGNKNRSRNEQRNRMEQRRKESDRTRFSKFQYASSMEACGDMKERSLVFRNSEGARVHIHQLELLKPMSVDELIAKMKKIQTDTAPGVDGVRKPHLRQSGFLQLLSKFYNLLILKMYYTAQWRMNRTTLILKTGKDASNIKNWGSITIWSLLSRVFSSMLDSRLRDKVQNHIRQKGFTKEDGCKHNTVILQRTLTAMKEKSGGVVTVIDVSKAFDTVPHAAIRDRLINKGIPAVVAKYIHSMYDDCKTRIRTGSEELALDIKRGVKQDDPLSPLMFNIVLDPIIQKLDENTEGVRLGDEGVSVLAFADDLVSLGKDSGTAARQIQMLDKYLKKLGMSIQADKCSAFQVVHKNKTWHLKDPGLRLNETAFPYTGPEDTLRYLGVNVSPWRGLRQIDVDRIVAAATNIHKMKLKPHQKVNIIRTHLLPKYIHEMVSSPPPIKTLESLDHEVKGVIKKILHLHLSTTDGVVYTEKVHGRLGIQKITDIVRIATLRSGVKILRSDDLAVREAYSNARIRRHNEIVDFIENKTSEHKAVFKESSINVIGDLKKPDLVIKDQDRLRVVDVTVRFEDVDGFRKAFKDKIDKYKETAKYLRARLNCNRAEVLPIVVGSRGAMPLSTAKNLRALGLGTEDIITISLIALRSSIEIANKFLDYDYIL
ncbi:uncharacterized protein LOC143221497 [Lasioglossum baleicum]|uniref:uncharacterized protein LOC143221497 n=1 Tax=Lasioglossum baleicum TaxID=434251 RepID=UPI003FCD309C